MHKYSLVVLVAIAAVSFVCSSGCFAQSIHGSLGMQPGILAVNAPVASSANASTAVEPDPAAMPATPAHSSGSWPGVGVGVQIGTLGIGGEVAVGITHRINIRGGFNFLSLGHSFSTDGINYTGTLALQSGEAHLDWFPFKSFHVSPGVLLYNGNNLHATVSVPGGQTFTLNDDTYTSDVADPVGGTGRMNFGYKVAPTFTIGFGNMVPRNGKHFTFTSDIGFAYQGAPSTTLNLTGSACDSNGLNCQTVASNASLQADIASEQVKINHDTRVFRFYPILSVGFGYRF